MNILFVSQLLPPENISGIPIITWNQAKELQLLGCTVHCLTSTNKKEKIYSTEIIEGITIHYVPHYSLNFVSHKKIIHQIIYSFALRKFIAPILNEHDFDVIHINDNLSLVSKIVMRLCREKKKPSRIVREFWFYEDVCFRQNLIISELNEICSGPDSIEKCIRCYFKTYNSGNMAKQFLKKIIIPHLIIKQFSSFQKELNQYDSLIFPDDDLKSFFLSIKHLQFNKKIFVIPHGIELKKKDKIIKYDGGSINFLFLGALYYRKGIDILLEAFEKLLSQNVKPFKLYIAGMICERIYFEKITALQQKYPQQITYLGEYIPQQIPEIIERNNIHCGIVPSYVETFSRVVREMLVNNLPVISTSFIGSSIIRDFVNGLRIPVGDSDALCKSMMQIISNTDLIQTLSAGAFQTKIISANEEGELLKKYYLSDKIFSNSSIR